ncbi:MAG TPA: DegQ family serine endoprotease [Candidatus Sulfotelmatobacter sp.]|jgi:serine protease Do|nr:DegQ family serine endoprotease [Candidatus Sulfotelmatobacter sp.]
MTPRHLTSALLMLATLALPAVASAQAVPQSREQVQMSFSPVVKQVVPAVVNIYTRRVVRQNMSPLLADPFFRQFLGQGMGLPKDKVERSLGSGVLVRADGVVVTNNHVIKNSQEITVVLADRREFEATLLGSDERTDLAVLKIDTGSQLLPTLQLGDSDSLEVGDMVLAMGNPFGVGQTVTMGIVSALARTGVGLSDYRSFIQTDAAINPGNSGGALVDLQGRLVGINSEIYSQSGGSVGIGFAIPSNMVKSVVDSIMTGGKAVRPWLGAGGQGVTGEMFQSLKLDHPQGVLISTIHKGSPAEVSGLKVGDVITTINGKGVDDAEALRFRIAMLPVGGTATLTVVRSGQPMTVQAKLAAPPDVPARDTTDVDGRTPFTGATIANMNPALADEVGLDVVEPGATIIRIKPGTIAYRLQFQPGDIIVKVNRQSIASVAELRAALAGNPQTWDITIRRNGETLSISLGN